MPVTGSLSSPTPIMSCASPRTPCSGPNSAVRFTPLPRNRSIAWRSSASTEVGLQISPTRLSTSSMLPSVTSLASPVRPAIVSDSGEDRDGLQRNLVVLGHDTEAHGAALVLRLELALVDLELRDEVRERDVIGRAHGLALRDVLGEHALVVVGLRLLRGRREIGIGGRLLAFLGLLELDAARDDRVALVVDLLLAGLG